MANTATISWLTTSALDPDAAAFIFATGITDPTTISAINTLVLSAKSNGWWSLCNAIYPYVGGSSSSCAYNLKDTSLYKITWTGSITFNSSGVTGDGSTGYGDTGLLPSSVLTIDNTHLSAYSTTANTNDESDIGAVSNASTSSFLLRTWYDGIGGTTSDAYGDGTQRITASGTTNSQGFYIATRISNTDFRLYKNGSQVGSTQTASRTTSLPSDRNIIVLGIVYGGPTQLSTRTYTFMSIGSGISSSIASLMNTDIQTFQTTLGRQV